MERTSLKIIGKEYNQEMLEIIQDSPIQLNNLTLCFDRSPNFFGLAEAGYNHSRYVGLFVDNKLEGFVGTCYFQGLIEDKEETIIYYTNLYVRKKARYLGFVYRSSKILFKEPYNGAQFGLTIVMKGNDKANKLIGRKSERYANSFYNKIVGTLIVKNILITTKKKESTGFQITRASETDIDAIVKLLQKQYADRLFAPIMNRTLFLDQIHRRPNMTLQDYYVAKRNNEIVGICAAWDTNSLKQTRILEYRGRFKLIKLFYQVAKPLLGFPSLPKIGEMFKDIHITDFGIKDDDPKVLEALIRRIYNDSRKLNYNTVVFGSYEEDPLLKSTNHFMCTEVISNIVLAATSEDILNSVEIKRPYINVSCL